MKQQNWHLPWCGRWAAAMAVVCLAGALLWPSPVWAADAASSKKQCQFYGMNYQFKKALVPCAEWARLDPKNPRAFNLTGHAYANSNKDLEAEAFFNRAIKLDPKYTDSINGLAELHFRHGHYKKAMALFNQSLAIKPNQPAAYTAIADCLIRTQHKRAAIPYLEKALKLDPKDDNAYYNLGLIYEDIGKRAQAEQAYEYALQLNGHNHLAKSHLVRLQKNKPHYPAKPLNARN